MWTSSDDNLIARLPAPVYLTDWGRAYCGDALELLEALPPESVDLVMTSPPFALQRTKSHGNADQSEYVDWLFQFAAPIHRVLKASGSLVIDLGGAYQKGTPIRSSALRFVETDTEIAMAALWERLDRKRPVVLRSSQMCLFR